MSKLFLTTITQTTRTAIRSSSAPTTRRPSLFGIRQPTPIFTPITIRNFSYTAANMGVTKTTITEGSGAIPQVGQTVVIEYTGWLKNADGSKGNQFDSSVGRGDFETRIGVGQVIKGWDEGVTQMKTGEKATLDISSDYAYGNRGFPGAIPANSNLIFDVELKKIK